MGLPGTLRAEPAGGLTIGDVAKMKPHERIKYVHHEASRRVLEIGMRHGDTVLRCLDDEIVEIVPKDGGGYIVPRGLKAAIHYIHIANNNGDASGPAAARIAGLVDKLATRLCGVPPVPRKSS